MNRIFKHITLAGVLALGIGCGGTELDESQVNPHQLESMEQAEEGVEERKVEDMIGALDSAEGVLHVQEGSEDTVLNELRAERQSDGSYLTKDALTGEETRFNLKPQPLPFWPTLFKRCPSTGQWVPYWQPCPVNIYSDRITRIWIRSSCSWKIQSPAVGVCVNSGSGSYRYQYVEAWRCGVGTGICVERRSATVLRYNYAFPACSNVSSVTTTAANYLCRR